MPTFLEWMLSGGRNPRKPALTQDKPNEGLMQLADAIKGMNKPRPADEIPENETPAQKLQRLLAPPEKKSDDNKPDEKKGLFEFTPESLQQTVSGIDFTRVISPEIMAKMAEGDSAAITQALNAVAQAGAAMQMQTSATMIEQALAKKMKEAEDNFGQQWRAQQLQTLQPVGDNFKNNPVAAKLYADYRDTIAAQHPNLTPQQVHDRAQDALNAAAQLFAPQQTKEQGPESDPNVQTQHNADFLDAFDGASSTSEDQ